MCVRAARPSGRARCGAGAGCSEIKYQSLWGVLKELKCSLLAKRRGYLLRAGRCRAKVARIRQSRPDAGVCFTYIRQSRPDTSLGFTHVKQSRPDAGLGLTYIRQSRPDAGLGFKAEVRERSKS